MAAKKSPASKRATQRKSLRRPVARATAKASRAPARKAAPKPRLDTGTPDAPYAQGGVTLHRIDHLTIRAFPEDMDRLKAFYEKALGLKAGKRPSFTFPGYWLYMGKRAVIHLAGNAQPGTPAGESGSMLGFDHVSFRTTGLDAVRARLRKHAIPFQEIPVPGFPLHQIFFRDPVGMKVELTFDAAELEAAPDDRGPASGSVHYRT